MKQLKLKPVISRGNSLYIQSYPVVGIISLIGFTESIEGEDSQNFFKKFFRYSSNGIDFSEWKSLTVENISKIKLNSKKVYLFEFRYDKVENLGVHQLKLKEFESTYKEDQLEEEKYFFSNSIFSSFFQNNNIKVLDWYINVLNKLYKKGIVPDFISRGKNKKEKEDYLQIWGSVAKFFAYYVALAKHFEFFHKDENLLFEFLKQRGIKISKQLDYETLSLLTQDFLVNFTKRGTKDIYKKKKHTNNKYDGELLRLIEYQEDDEFLIALRKSQEIGWNVGNSSPLHRGMFKVENANKFYELDPSFENEKITINGEYETEYFIVDSKLDYHLYLIGEGDGEFSIEVKGLDEDGNSIDCISYKTGEVSNVFIEGGRFYRGDKKLPISLFLYNERKHLFEKDTTNIKQGNDLILPTNIRKIKFIIKGNNFTLSNRVFSVLKTPYSHGLIQVRNVIDAFIKNNNYSMNFKEIHLFVEKYLIPYNSHLLSIDLNDERVIDENKLVEEDPEIKTKWIEGEGYCEVNSWRGVNPTCEVIDVKWIGDQTTTYCKKVVENGIVKYNGELHYLWLHEINALTGEKTGRTKPNLPGDPDYIAPISNHQSCVN